MNKRAHARQHRTAWLGGARKVATILNGRETTSHFASMRVLGSRQLAMAIADVAVVCAAYPTALLLRLRGDVPTEAWQSFAYALPIIAACYLLANAVFGGYRAGWRYGVNRDMAGLLVAVTLVTVALFAVNASFSHRDIPLSANVLGGGLILLGQITVRAWPQAFRFARASLLDSSTALKAAVSRDPLSVAGLSLAVLFLLGVYIFLVIRYAGLVPADSDDGRVMLFTAQILRDPGTWIAVLPLLQYFAYGMLVTLFGWGAPLVFVPLLFSLALAMLIGYVAYRMTGGKLWAFLAAAFAMSSLPVFFAQSRSLTFHAPALFFGYLGVFAAINHMRQGGRWPLAVAGLALPAAFYSYNIGLLFLLIPPLFLLVDRSRATLTRLISIYGVVFVLAAPWLVSHLATFDLDHFFRQRESWALDQGYLELRNVEFFGIGSESRFSFLTRLPNMFEGAAGPLIIALVFFSVVGLVWMPNWSWRSAALVALAIPIAALLYVTPAAYTRYTYMVLPGLVLLSVYGLTSLLNELSVDRRASNRATVLRIATIGLLAMLVLQRVDDNISKEPVAGKELELAQVAQIIDDGKGVIGSRVAPLIRYERDSELLIPDFVSQEDFVTYLSWPSDETVAEMLQRKNVGWLLIRHPADKWEISYNAWLTTVTGQPPQHFRMVDSPLAERVYKGNWYSLHRVVDTAVLAAQAEPESQER
jgi:4-amino-4-deoxy-L-arabinose transferase-like glycosyltransferase